MTVSNRSGSGLVQGGSIGLNASASPDSLVITCLLIFSFIIKPSANPHGLMAMMAGMIVVTAMGSQFALQRLTLRVAPSTAVMTGNLTNAVLTLLASSSRTQPLMEPTAGH
jgi:uncharacterized membrane protein YoaK (UPF0700 family)